MAVGSVKAAVRMALASTLPAGLKYENKMTLCFAAGDQMRENREGHFSQ